MSVWQGYNDRNLGTRRDCDSMLSHVSMLELTCHIFHAYRPHIPFVEVKHLCNNGRTELICIITAATFVKMQNDRTSVLGAFSSIYSHDVPVRLGRQCSFSPSMTSFYYCSQVRFTIKN